MLLSFLFLFLVPAFFGVSLLGWARALEERVAFVLAGVFLGITISTTLVFALSLSVPLSLGLIVGQSLLLGIAALVIWRHSSAAAHWGSLRFDAFSLVPLVGSFFVFGVIGRKLLILRETGLFTGSLNSFGDLPLHLALITSFRTGQTFPPENPIHAGTHLIYPFMSDFFSALMMVLGTSIPNSVNVPAMVLIPLLVVLFYCAAREITRSRKAAAIALTLFVLGGSTWGFSRIANDYSLSGKSTGRFLLELPERDYGGLSMDSERYHFVNPVASLLLAQRSFLFGMPIAFCLMLLLIGAPAGGKKASFALAGILVGLLPFFHTHTMLVVLVGLGIYFVTQPKLPWLWLGIPAAVLGLPEVSYFLSAKVLSSHVTWHLGWESGTDPFLLYVFKNFGLLVPLAVLGMFSKAPRTAKQIAGIGLVLFGLGMTVQFARFGWDNYKIFVFWLIFTLPLIAWILAEWTSSRRHWSLRLTAVSFVVLHCLSGALDTWKLMLPTSREWAQWEAPAIIFALKMKQRVPSDSIILTAPVQNTLVSLTGHRIYLGLPGHVWGHGGDPVPREIATKAFFEGAQIRLPGATPDYVLVGPMERSMFPGLQIHPSWKVVAQEGGYILYSLGDRSLTQQDVPPSDAH